jgi:hypothetical protein
VKKAAPERGGPVGAEDRFHAGAPMSKRTMIFDRSYLLC